MSSLDSEHVRYAQGVVSRLWPQPADVEATTRRSAPSDRRVVAEWLLLPSPRRPTLLVPTRVARASRMLQRHGNKFGPRVGRASLAWGVRSGALAHLPVSRVRVTVDPGQSHEPGESALDQLAQSVPDVHSLGVILGTPRPNRKPVLQLFAREGATVGFVKVGVDDFTRRLVRTEQANLTVVQAAGLRTIDVPQVLDLASFNDLDLLVLSPMGSSQERREAAMPVQAMAELARSCGVETQALVESTYWQSLTGSAMRLGSQPGAADLSAVANRVIERWGDCEIAFGSWHGDWAPWNMGYQGGRVQLWDWERFSRDVPLGFDALHFRSQRVRHGQANTAEQESALVAAVPDLLEQVGAGSLVREPALALSLYLLEVSGRFLTMSADRPGSAVHPRARWALDLAGRLVG